MNVATMRRVDRWLGVPACAGLTALRRVVDFFVRDKSQPVRRILFVKLAEQGATVLAYPALRQAVAKVGRENVFVLVFEENRFVLDALNVIPPENIIAIRATSIGGAVWNCLRALGRLRSLRIDAAIDFEFFARSSAILAYLSGARVRSGLHCHSGEGPYRGDLMTHRVPYNAYLHVSQTFLLLLDALDVSPGTFPTSGCPPAPPEDAVPLFAPTPADQAEISALLRGAVCDGAPLILLNANCSDLLPIRKWADANYDELAGGLLARYPDLHIAFTGARGEAPGVEKLVKSIGSPRCHSFAGKTSLRGLLTLYGKAEVLVTNDSGPAHFATMTPVDVVTLFGPETPQLFAARTPRNHVLWAGLACSPCVNAFNNRLSKCRDNACMRHISVKQVFDLTCSIYEARRARNASAQPVALIPAQAC